MLGETRNVVISTSDSLMPTGTPQTLIPQGFGGDFLSKTGHLKCSHLYNILNMCIITLHRRESPMTRPKKNVSDLLDQRMVIMMSKAEIDLIDDWMFSQRIRSRGEAVRRLVTAGMLKNLKEMKAAREAKLFTTEESQ